MEGRPPEGLEGRFLDPKILQQVSSLSLRARYVVEGVLTGFHRSVHRGQSIEFAEHKEYSPGDEIRHIDWKAFAKRDKCYVKQFEHETNLRAWIVLDASGSMGYAGGEGGMSKFEYGATLTASLGYLMLQQLDAVGLLTFQGGIQRYVPPRARSSHLQAIMEVLEKLQPAGRIDLPSCLHGLQEKVRRRGMVILISDLLGPIEKILMPLKLLRHRMTEVIIFHLLSEDELEFPFSSPSIFQGLEGEGDVQADPDSVRRAYLEELHGFLDLCRKGSLEQDIDYCLCRTSDPLDRSLVRYLARRSAL